MGRNRIHFPGRKVIDHKQLPARAVSPARWGRLWVVDLPASFEQVTRKDKHK